MAKIRNIIFIIMLILIIILAGYLIFQFFPTFQQTILDMGSNVGSSGSGGVR